MLAARELQPAGISGSLCFETNSLSKEVVELESAASAREGVKMPDKNYSTNEEGKMKTIIDLKERTNNKSS